MFSRITRRVKRYLFNSRRVLCLSLLLFPALAAVGQVDQGTITGMVQDPSGAVLPNAKVIITNTDTGLVLERNANPSGNYTFSPLKIGNYKITATAPGFRTTEESVHLDIQQRLNLVLTLNPGTV